MAFYRFAIAAWTLVLANTGAVEFPGGLCDLDCDPDKSLGCFTGPADFSGFLLPNGKPLSLHAVRASENNMHCECKDGFTGLECKQTYDTCDNLSHKCYNGGTCADVVTDDLGNTTTLCDCKRAIDEEGVRYAGKFCEHPAVEICGNNREVFCVNGGTCKPDFKEHPNRPCLCDEEHDGQHCEFTKDDFPDCGLKCENNGSCQLGIKTYAQAQAFAGYNNFWDSNENLMYCVCEPGFYGVKCEVESSTCGDYHCFNGGTCVEKTSADGTTKRYCDCTTGTTESQSFSGRYCQYESTKFCSDRGDPNGKAFCVNGGTCNSNGTHLGCDCPDGFSGPICEFHETENNEEYAECKLDCLNGGKCRKGAKDLSFLKDKGVNASHLLINSNEDNEHCVCRPGFVGLTCEHKLEVCDENHICLHGAQCVPVDGHFACDCDTSSSAFDKFAGKFCEHKATTMCTENDGHGLAFCVNNGECIDFVGPSETHKGCRCPKEFEGEHCQYSRTQDAMHDAPQDAPQYVPRATIIPQVAGEESSSSSSSKRVGVIVTVVILVAVAGFVGGAIIVWNRRRWKKVPMSYAIDKSQSPFPLESSAPKHSVTTKILSFNSDGDYGADDLCGDEII